MDSKNIVLCDTNIIIEYLKGNQLIVNELESIGKNSIYISSITAGEIYYGAINKEELNRIRKKLNWECKLNSVCFFSVIQIYIFLESTPKCFLEYCSKSVKGGEARAVYIPLTGFVQYSFFAFGIDTYNVTGILSPNLILSC